MLVVLTTLPTVAVSESLAEEVVRLGLAACVQVLPAMTSVYRWNGELQKHTEHLLLIKTTPDRYDELEAFLQANHPYDVPEIVALEAERFSASYLDFVARSTFRD